MKNVIRWLLPLILVACFGGWVLAGDITDTGMSQKDLYKLLRNVVKAINNGAYGNAGLTTGTTTPAYIKTANSISYAVDGLFYTKAATDNIATATATAQAANTYCLYLLTLNSSGTLAATKGTELATDTAILPDVPASVAPIGILKIATTTTFTLGTTSLTASGVTATFYNLRAPTSGNYDVNLKGL